MTSGRQAVKGEIGRWFLGILSVFLGGLILGVVLMCLLQIKR